MQYEYSLQYLAKDQLICFQGTAQTRYDGSNSGLFLQRPYAGPYVTMFLQMHDYDAGRLTCNDYDTGRLTVTKE